MTDQIAEVFALRQAYWANGYRPLEVWNPDQTHTDGGEKLNSPGKQPRGPSWQKRAMQDPPEAVRLKPDSRALNTGLLCGEQMTGADVDVPVQALADRIVNLAEVAFGPTPLVRIGQAPKILLVYRTETAFGKLQTPELFMTDGTKCKVELLARGQQFIASGVHPITRKPYRWTDGTPETVRLDELPVINEEQAKAFIEDAERLLRAAGAKEKEKPKTERANPTNNQKRTTESGQFFSEINRLALDDIPAWARWLFPRIRFEPGTGAWRVSSADLNRPLQEDISIHPQGIQDFGEEEPQTAIDLVLRYGGIAAPLEAALWLCDRLSIDPESLGYTSRRKTKPTQRQPGLANTFRLVRFRDVRLDTSAAYLVDDIIPRDALVVVWGAPKSGKSFWCFDVAMHVAIGRLYRGHDVQPGPTIYVACEGERGLKARVAAFRQAKLDRDELDPPFFLVTTRLDLVNQADALIADIAAQLAEAGITGPVLVVLDTLNRSLIGSEGKDEDMSNYIRAADRVREAFRCTLVLVHHCGLDDSRPRGHTSLTAAADAQIAIKRTPSALITSTVEWLKDGFEGVGTISRLRTVDLEPDDRGRMITSCVVDDAASDASGISMGNKPVKVTGQDQIALRALTNALTAAGTVPPASNHIPQNKVCVTMDLWRRYSYDSGITDSDNAKTREKAFSRASKNLIGATPQLVGCWQDLVWIP